MNHDSFPVEGALAQEHLASGFDCQSLRILLDSALVYLYRAAPGMHRSLPNCQNELLGELQAFNTVRAADVVLLKSRPSFSRQGSKQVRFSYGIRIGIWLGLIASAAIAYGGYLTMSEEGALQAASRRPTDQQEPSRSAP